MERRLTRPEHDIMMMVPNAPHAEQQESVVVGLRDTRGSPEAGQNRDVGVAEGDAQHAPEGSREGAIEEEMVGILYAGIADLTGFVVNQRFTEQVGFRVQPVVDEKPYEEFDAARRRVALDELQLGHSSPVVLRSRYNEDVRNSEEALGEEGTQHVSAAAESTTGSSMPSRVVSSDIATVDSHDTSTNLTPAVRMRATDSYGRSQWENRAGKRWSRGSHASLASSQEVWQPLPTASAVADRQSGRS